MATDTQIYLYIYNGDVGIYCVSQNRVYLCICIPRKITMLTKKIIFKTVDLKIPSGYLT